MFFDSLAAFAVGLLIRIGLPLLLTVVLVWALRRLDARWQADAKRISEASSQNIIQIQAQRCWELRNCAPLLRENCLAFKKPHIPCWQHFRNGRGELREMCLDCEVFHNAPLPMAA